MAWRLDIEPYAKGRCYVEWIEVHGLFPRDKNDVPDDQLQPWELPRAELAIGQAPISEIVQAELIEPSQQVRRPVRRRRVMLPLVLFALTCASTFFAGATQWAPTDYVGDSVDFLGPYFLLPARIAILEHWRDGVIYMACVLAILLTHEMGHFVMTVI